MLVGCSVETKTFACKCTFVCLGGFLVVVVLFFFVLECLDQEVE